MTSMRIAITALMVGTLFTVPAGHGAPAPGPYHQGGSVHHGGSLPAPHGGGQWPSIQHRPVQPPPPRSERVPHARRGYHWVPGHYAWRGSWAWMPGLWIVLQPGCGWVPPHWQWFSYGWVWLEGYWVC